MITTSRPHFVNLNSQESLYSNGDSDTLDSINENALNKRADSKCYDGAVRSPHHSKPQSLTQGFAMSYEEKCLEMPYIAILPYQILIDKSLAPACKIHFAILCGLSKKYGYCFATDKQLAELQEVSVQIIERWNMSLERSGHITRKTINEHITEYKRQNPKQKFIKRRKIYINNAFVSKEVSEPLQKEGSVEPLQIEGSVEPLQKEGYKSKPLKEKKDNKPMKEKEVVVPESLDDLDLEESQKMNIASKFSGPEIDKAVERALRWKKRPSDIVGVMTALNQAETWSDNATTAEVETANKEFLKKFKYLDMSHHGSVDIYIGPTYIQFVSGMKNTQFSIDDPSFKKDVLDYLKYLKVLE